MKPGANAIVAVSAFSFEPKIYANEGDYLHDQESAKVRYAANFFVPSGLFKTKLGGAMDDKNNRPTAYADFAGKVLKAELRTNENGQGKFWWAGVQTYNDATIDVLMDPRTVSIAPGPDAVISGRFWLTGRLVETK